MTHRHTAAELIALVADPGSFQPWDTDVVSTDPLSFSDTRPYADRLRAAAARSEVSEAIVTGSAAIDGREVVMILGEFSFLGGTLGVATAERVIRAFERAVEQRLPIVAMPISGGTRMQEGTAGFVHMASCAAAVQRCRDAGLLYVVYLRNPTTGGVLGSWASLAHVRLAEPGALIGLTGPRVIKALTGRPLPEGAQSSETLREHGMIDALVAPAELRSRLCQILQAADPPGPGWQAAVEATVLDDSATVAGWDAVVGSRAAGRPTVCDVLRACGTDLFRLRGDGAGHDDDRCIVGLGQVCGVPSMVLAQARDGDDGRGAALGATGYRMYRRAIDLASELGVPIVTVIDTAGAAMTAEDEAAGLAAMIAGCLAAMSATPSPTLAVLLGEGSGGGAVALLPADAVIAAAHAWLAPIAPEGASAILYRSTERAAEVAAAQRISATDLRRMGIVDAVVPDSDAQMPERLAAVMGEHLRRLVDESPEQRLAARRRRYRSPVR